MTSLKRTPIRRRSKKKVADDAAYQGVARAFLDKPENRRCRAALWGCTGANRAYMTVHHSKGRGKYLLDTSTFIPLCLTCHREIETNPEAARELGFTQSRINP